MAKTLYTLAEARKKAGLSQTDAAEQLGVNNKTLAGYERYKSVVDVHRAKELAALYGVELDEIIFSMSEIDDIKRALTLNGITDKDSVELEQVSGRVKIVVNGEYYGVWDTLRRTFVD